MKVGDTAQQHPLNPQQLEAVTHGEGPQLVLAGAGSGKTRVITHRIAWLVQKRGVAPEAIVAVTFTNKAATEMRHRVGALLGPEALPTFVGTFHRYALRLLRRWGDEIGLARDFVIFDADDQLKLVRQALEDEGLAESAFPPRAVRAAISAAKNRLVGVAAYGEQADGFFERKVAPVYVRYQAALRQSGAVDFDDMLALAVRLLAEREELRGRLRERVQWLLVDEFQDTNHAQLQLVRGIIGGDGNLTAVGDEDQGIYRWRGADLQNVLRFEASFPGATIRKLERNYRSTGTILEAAGVLVEHNERRRGKRLWTEAEAGEAIQLYKARDEADEARSLVASLTDLEELPLSEVAVLVRTNAQTRVFEEELMAHRIPYQLVGGVRFYERAEIKDLLAYLRLLRNPRDEHSLGRILNQPPRGIGKVSEEQARAEAKRRGITLWDLLEADELASVPSRGAAALRTFREVIQGLQEFADDTMLPRLVERVLEESGLAAHFNRDDEEAQSRRENLREFVSAAQEYVERQGGGDGLDRLTGFLDHAALESDLDDWEEGARLSLMTLHSAKGLEFDAVAIAGLEEGLLPHFNAGEEQEEVEEERRLLYVGMTRARRRLFLSHARRRRIAGRYQDRRESPFLGEIPAKLLEVNQSPELFRSPRSAGVDRFFGRRHKRYGPATQENTAPSRGTRVRHPTLGPGVLVASDGDGPDAKLTVVFDHAGKKKLIAKHARLEEI